MKTKYLKLTVLFIASLLIAFASCDSSTEVEQIITEEKADLELEESHVIVFVDEATVINIESGNGEFKVFSLDENIAEASVEEDKLIITGVSKGITDIIISDNSGQYKLLTAESQYNKLVFEEQTVNISMKLGNNASKTIAILGGNGDYTAESEDPEIATPQINGDMVIINARKEGSTTITIEDALGITNTIKVDIETTTIPYEGDELEEIKNNSRNRFVFNGSSTTYEVKKYNDSDYHVYGWNNSVLYLQKVYFKGDIIPGVKEEAFFSYVERWSDVYEMEPIYLEILKVEDGKIWAMFSFINKDKLQYGHFVSNI